MSAETPPDFSDGGCLCGAVRYRVTGAPLSSIVCHCHSCRLASGAPAVAWVSWTADRVRLLRGHPASHHASPQAVRSFCPRCGTPLSYRHADEPDVLDLTTATLDHPERFPPTDEAWLEHRIGWQPLDPARAQHRRSSDEPATQ
jgi:hypothetical protein